MKRIPLVLTILLVLVVVGSGLWWRSVPSSTRTPPTLATYLSSDNNEGFAQATEPNGVEFPRDLGAHNEYQTEWWYYTGNLETADGRPFGYQFTIFRRAIAPPTEFDPDTPSDWRSNQIYFAHFAVSDIANDTFYSFDKFSRGAAGLAGAESDPYHIWIEAWEMAEQPDGSVQLRAQTETIALDLMLTQTQPPVLHGNGGLSQKGEEVGNASYYYSLINQTSVGTLTIDDQVLTVSGHSWKDHEYSTSALAPNAVGWDWFSLTFDNEAKNSLMFFNIRQEDGSIQANSGGSWIMADSTVEGVSYEETEIEVLDDWTSPRSGAVYPAAWRIRIPHLDLEMEGRPLMADQELDIAQIYWEGAVQFTGMLGEEPVTATGYIEMTGYEPTE